MIPLVPTWESCMMRCAWYALLLCLTAGACRPAGRTGAAEEAPSRETASTPPDTVTDPNDPWASAAARGVVFRAVGNEPGWYAEVDAGSAPTVRLVLDYGERRLTVEGATLLPESSGFRGMSGELAVELKTTDRECSDGMSDASYPITVELRVGEQVYQGCGRRLEP